MFEFFKHKNVTEKEEVVTANTTEQAVDSAIEIEGGTNAELFYASPEYKEAVEAYELVGPEVFFTDLQKELTTDTGDLYEDDFEVVVDELDVDPSELITEVSVESVVVDNDATPELPEESVIEGEHDTGTTSKKIINIGKGALSLSVAATVGFLAACDRTTKNEFGVSPSFKWGSEGKPHTVEFGVGFRTKNEQIDLDGKTIKPESTTAKPEVKPQPEKVSPVVEKTSGKNMESTTPTKVGVAEVFEKYSKEILPSGDPRYGYLTLNDATADAAAAGGLKPISELGVYALEVSEDPAKQGIPYKSIWLLKLSENKIPRPVIKGDSSFNNYISRTRNGVYHVNPEKLNAYKRDLANSVPESSFKNAKGVIDYKKRERVLRVGQEYGLSELNIILQWKNANPAERAALLEKWVKPYQNRTGTIRDKK